MERGEATQDARDLIADFGISERTAWRWLAKLRDPESDFDGGFQCRACRADLPDNATSRRRYCDDRCRTYGRRGRLAKQANAEAAARRARLSNPY